MSANAMPRRRAGCGCFIIMGQLIEDTKDMDYFSVKKLRIIAVFGVEFG
jgi:hypothetical protein